MKKTLLLLSLLIPLGLNAQVLHTSGSITPKVSKGTAIEAGQKYSTSANSQLFISPVAGLTLSLGENTILEIVSINDTRGQEAATVFLHKGTVFTDITTKVKFSLQTPQQSIQSRGTSWSTNYDSATGIRNILITNGTINITTSKDSYNLTSFKIAITDQDGNVSIYDNLEEIPKKKRFGLEAALIESENIIKIAQAQGIVSPGGLLTGLRGPTPTEGENTQVDPAINETVNIGVDEPVVSGF